MAFKIKNGEYGFPQSGESVAVYYTGTDQLVQGLKTPDSEALELDNPFVISDEQDWWGFEPPSTDRVDVWWVEQRRYIVENVMCCDVTLLDNPFPQYITQDDETDPIFTAWDKSEGINIYTDQITDLLDYQHSLTSGTNIKTINGQSLLGSGDIIVYADPQDETDPVFTAWNKRDGISITESQISDFGDYQDSLISGTNIKTVNGQSIVGSGNVAIHPNETDPVFTAWNKRDGILISKSQITNLKDYNEELNSGVNIKTINGESILGSGTIEIGISETDPIFTVWNKRDGISVTESQISDFGDYQELLYNGANIKSINGESLLGSGNIVIDAGYVEELDPIFTAWNKRDGISITESQISDFGIYQDSLTSGTNIKTINGESLLGSGNIEIVNVITEELDPVFTAWNKRDGISITESQISDFGDYQEPLVSGTNIKTINGESLLGGGDLVISGNVDGAYLVDLIDDSLNDTSWKNDGTGTGVEYVGNLMATFAPVDDTWLPCDGTEYLVEDYPELAPMMEVASVSPGEKKLYSWGRNDSGELGLGDTTDRSSPVQVGSLTNWSDIDGGYSYTVAIKTDGTLWSWGANGSGQLGLGDTTDRSSPLQVGSLTDWSNISSGTKQLLAIKTDGTLWSWGANNHGQLGLGDTTYRSSPVQVGSLTDWSDISCGSYHVSAVKTDGTLWSWGRNDLAQLGLGDTTNRSSPVQVGTNTDWSGVSCSSNDVEYHSLATKTDGTLWAWGYNYHGALGLGVTIIRKTPVQVGSLADWSGVSCGSDHTLATKTDGTLWSWGANGSGQLGLGDTTDRSSPLQVGSLTDWSSISCGASHSLAIKTDGTLWTWGRGISSPVQVGSLTDWSKVSCGDNHSLAISGEDFPFSFYTSNIIEPNGIGYTNMYYVKAK